MRVRGRAVVFSAGRPLFRPLSSVDAIRQAAQVPTARMVAGIGVGQCSRRAIWAFASARQGLGASFAWRSNQWGTLVAVRSRATSASRFSLAHAAVMCLVRRVVSGMEASAPSTGSMSRFGSLVYDARLASRANPRYSQPLRRLRSRHHSAYPKFTASGLTNIAFVSAASSRQGVRNLRYQLGGLTG